MSPGKPRPSRGALVPMKRSGVMLCRLKMFGFPTLLLRWKPVERIDTDLMVGASPHALFYRGVDTVSTRRAIYHQYEQGRLLGAFKHGSLIASRKSAVLAAMWAQETKKLDARTVQLMELHLQLRELAAALGECDGDREALNKLNALLEATEAAIGEALKILSPPPGAGGA